MKPKIKFFIYFILLILIVSLMPMPALTVNAINSNNINISNSTNETNEDENDISNNLPDQLIKASGLDNITNTVQNEAKSILEKYNIDVGNPESIKNLNFSSMCKILLETISSKISSPFKLFSLLLVITIVSSIINSLGYNENKGQIFETISILAAILSFTSPLCTIFQNIKDTLGQCSDFMTMFTPVFASVLIVSGNTGTAIGYQTGMFALTSIVIQVLEHMLLPILNMSFSITITDSLNPTISLKGILNFTKKITTWILGFIMSIFIGITSIQSIVSNTTDTFTTKTTKYIISNFIPVIGGAVSDAHSTILGSIKILKSMTGIIGILLIAVIFIPIIIEIILYRISISAASAIAELFSVDYLANFLKGIQQILSIAFAILICFLIMFLVSTTLILIITNNNTIA